MYEMMHLSQELVLIKILNILINWRLYTFSVKYLDWHVILKP